VNRYDTTLCVHSKRLATDQPSEQTKNAIRTLIIPVGSVCYLHWQEESRQLSAVLVKDISLSGLRILASERALRASSQESPYATNSILWGMVGYLFVVFLVSPNLCHAQAQKRQSSWLELYIHVDLTSGVAKLSAARSHHKIAALFTLKICLQEFKMKEDHVSCLFKDIRIDKASWTSRLNTHKLKWLLFFIFDYKSSFFCLLPFSWWLFFRLFQLCLHMHVWNRNVFVKFSSLLIFSFR